MMWRQKNTGLKLGLGMSLLLVLSGTFTTAPLAQNLDYDQGQYQDQMLRLSSILGSLHHIRGMCASGEHQLWRDNMMELIRLEDPPDERKNKMVGAFNEAYNDAQTAYPSCSGEAKLKAQQLAGEGARISSSLAAGFSSDEG